jgi:hypothetical protein
MWQLLPSPRIEVGKVWRSIVSCGEVVQVDTQWIVSTGEECMGIE